MSCMDSMSRPASGCCGAITANSGMRRAYCTCTSCGRGQVVAQADIVLALARTRRLISDDCRIFSSKRTVRFDFAELADDAWQQLAAERLVGRDADQFLPDLAQLADLRTGPLGVQRGAPRIGLEQLAGLGQHHAARVALEQLGLVLVLQFAHHAADRRRGDMQLLRGQGQRAGVDDFRK